MENKKIKRDRNTSTKDEIIALLRIKNSALAHKDFQDYFNGKLDRVTIYRALDRLVAEEKLHKIANLEGVIQYALCKSCEDHEHHHNHDHIHFSCIKCKETTCIENIIPEIKLPNNYQVIEKQFLISGICPKCY